MGEVIAAMVVIGLALTYSSAVKKRKQNAKKPGVPSAAAPAPVPPLANAMQIPLSAEEDEEEPEIPIPMADPKPRPGHEECDPTEGSMEIPGRSPEGSAGTEGKPEPILALARPVRRENAPGVRPGMTARQMRQAIITSEILGKPVALRRRGSI